MQLQGLSSHDLTWGGRVIQVGKLAAPAAATMMSYSLVGLVDTLAVGQLGPSALAAVGLANTILMTAGATVTGLLSATTALTAQNEGAGQKAEAGQYLHQATWLGVVGGGLVGLLLAVFAAPLFALVQPGDDVTRLGVPYLQIRALGLPLFYLVMARDHFLEGLGDTRTPMQVSLLVNVVNAVLNYTLIYGLLGIPAMGVNGSAVATVLAHLISFVAYRLPLARLHRRAPEYQILPLQKPRLSAMRQMLAVGWPMSVQYTLDLGAWLLMTIQMTWLGALAQAGHQVALRLLGVSFMTIHGVSVAATTLVGQYLGAGEVSRARQYAWAALLVGLGITGVTSALYLLMPEWLAHIFTSDPEVVTLAGQLLMMGALLQVVDTLAMVTYGALKGAGDTRYPMVVLLACAWGVGLPLTWLLVGPMGLGPHGIYWAVTGQLVVAATLMLRRLLGDRWLSQSLVAVRTQVEQVQQRLSEVVQPEAPASERLGA